MNSTIELLKTCFDRENWIYMCANGRFLNIGLDGHLLQWCGKEDAICVDVYFEAEALLENWPKVISYVEVTNQRMMIGNLRTDSNAELIWFHHALGFPEGELTESLIQKMLTHTLYCSNFISRELNEIASTLPDLHIQNHFSGEELL